MKLYTVKVLYTKISSNYENFVNFSGLLVRIWIHLDDSISWYHSGTSPTLGPTFTHDVELKAYLHRHTTHNGRIRLTAFIYTTTQTTFQHGLPVKHMVSLKFGTKVWNFRNFKSREPLESQSKFLRFWTSHVMGNAGRHTKIFKIEATTVFCNLANRGYSWKKMLTSTILNKLNVSKPLVILLSQIGK
jgi:hypothetical protein